MAIKILPDGFASDPDRLARFEREAQTLAALNHPNIAQVFGVVEQPPALVMELVEGEDFAQRLRRGAIPLARGRDRGPASGHPGAYPDHALAVGVRSHRRRQTVPIVR